MVLFFFLAPLRWSQSLSKDTGLGSTTQTNDTPMSCLDLIHTPTMEQTSGNISISVPLQEKAAAKPNSSQYPPYKQVFCQRDYLCELAFAQMKTKNEL